MMDLDPKGFRSFEEFWPHYLAQHKNPLSRRFHFVGTLLSFLCLAGAAILQQPLFLLGAFAAGYVPAWLGHFLIEGNRPATFKNPFYSLLGDWRLFGLILNGRIKGELDRLGIKPDA